MRKNFERHKAALLLDKIYIFYDRSLCFDIPINIVILGYMTIRIFSSYFMCTLILLSDAVSSIRWRLESQVSG